MSTASPSSHSLPTYPEKAAVSGSPSFWTSKIGSLLGILPLGVWTVNHLWDNLAVWSGAEAWEKSVTHYAHPAAYATTLVIVLLPLVLHAIWGIKRLFSFRPNNGAYGYFGNFKYLLQRVAAVGVLFFLGAHIFLAMIRPRLFWGHAEAFSNIAAEMHWHTPTLLVYLLGTLGVSYHLGNGLWSWAFGFGLTASRPALKRFDYIGIGFFLVLLAMSWGVIYAMYQAGGAYPPVAD